VLLYRKMSIQEKFEAVRKRQPKEKSPQPDKKTNLQWREIKKGKEQKNQLHSLWGEMSGGGKEGACENGVGEIKHGQTKNAAGKIEEKQGRSKMRPKRRLGEK